MAVCKDIRLGKILIQTNHDTGEPEVCAFGSTGTGAGRLSVPNPVRPLLLPPPASLPPSTQRHQRGLRHPDGQHRVHRSGRPHGRQGSAGGSPDTFVHLAERLSSSAATQTIFSVKSWSE